MSKHHTNNFPNESGDYRQSRDKLLSAEIKLRRQLNDVAELRKSLPPGGKLKKDYVFIEGGNELSDTTTIKNTRFSELFDDGKNNLIIYSLMYAPDTETPCPACTSLLDGLNGIAPHVRSRDNFVVVARASIEKIRDWARQRSWHNLRLLSSNRNTYNIDYHAENEDGAQEPAINVFRKTEDGIFHFYNAELLYSPCDEGQHPRHADLYWPIWNLFDITPDGRNTGWFPKYTYDE
ncbi:MAG: DUF899 family protein [Proteobacteria bacterium]|nr:DUF899 family protein [Pseudomonadota bacterium]